MGIVYMICCNISGEVYYGSTIMDWKHRLKAHRNKRNHSISKQIITRQNYDFIILEEVDADQLLIREKYYVTTFPCININLPFSTIEEKNQKNIKYREDHKEELKQHNSKPFECECGSIFRYDKQARHRKSKKHLAFYNGGSK
jgi:hypothetical protein